MSVIRRNGSARVGLALGGGGARGAVHVGVLKLLEKENIPVDCIAGTSIGSLIGALYAITLNVQAVEKRLEAYLESETFSKMRFDMMSAVSDQQGHGIFTRLSSFIKKGMILTLVLSRPYLISQEKFRENLAFFLQDIRIEDLRLPFAAVTADLETGEEVIITEGPLLDAVYASCTFPGVVEAVRHRGRLLVDGGTVTMVPVEAAKQLGAEVVIAVNAERSVATTIDEISGLDIVFRVDDIMSAALTHCKTKDADILIKPELGDTRWYEIHRMQEFIPVGESAALEHISAIRQAIVKRNAFRFWKAGVNLLKRFFGRVLGVFFGQRHLKRC